MEEEVLKKALECLVEQEIAEVLESMEERSERKFSLEFEDKIQKLVSKANRRYVSISGYSIRRTVLIAVIAMLLLTGCVSIKPIREAIIQYWTNITQKNTTISLIKKEDEIDSSFVIKKLIVPKGYHIVSENFWIENGWYDCEYENTEKDLISYIQVRLDNMTTSIDTENTEIEEIKIQVYDVKLISNQGMNNIIWTDDTYFYHLCGTCEMTELKMIVEESVKR